MDPARKGTTSATVTVRSDVTMMEKGEGLDAAEAVVVEAQEVEAVEDLEVAVARGSSTASPEM